MRVIIFGNGDIKDYDRVKKYISDDDYVICADGGYNHTKKMNIKVDLLIGDFDSIKEMPENIEKMQYPVRKEMTDSQIALETAMKKSPSQILLFGFTGDRIDHSLNNLMLLLKYPSAVIIDDNNEVMLLNGELNIDGRIGQTISIIPINGDLCGITTTGLDYPLKDETLYVGDSRGVSNVIKQEKVSIKCKSGKGLVIKVEKV